MSDSYLKSSHTVKHLQKEKVLKCCLGAYMLSASSECGKPMVIQAKSSFLV